MRRSSMIMGGTVLGAAAVMVMPRPSTPQQVAIAGNAGATKARHAKQSSSQPATTAAQTTSSTGAAKPKPKPAAPAVKTVVGSLATDQYGQLQVKLTVANNRITKVGFASFIANDGHSMQIDQYAAPVLIRETIAAQSAHIQGVSGATYTSMAYQQSLQAAIDKAGLKA